MLTEDERERWATRLERARIEGTPVPPPTETLPELGVRDAYAIAQHGIRRRVGRGARVVGHKIGLTAVAVQRQLGVDSPDYGTLLDDMLVPDGGVADARALIAPKVELEVAFVLREALAGPAITADEVQHATESVAPAIEIVDSRVADWRISLADTVADNASSGLFVLGAARPPGELDVTAIEATLFKGAAAVERGRSDAVLGDPRVAVAWLAEALAAHGGRLDAGQVVLSGACTRMVDAVAGDAFRGDFGPLGTVSVSFAEAA